MTLSPRGRARISVPILLVSAITWMVLLINPGSTISIAHCPVSDSGASLASFQMLLAMNPVSTMTAGWALMLVAMMSPTLIAPVCHIFASSFKRRRVRCAILFVTGYAAIWMAAGGVLLAASLLLSWLGPQSYLPAVAVGLIAIVWQCSPLKQRCLNRGHYHPELAAFGMAADLDALRFGITHAIWCVGSCWALMLFPMMLVHGHFAAMGAVTLLMISERLESPSRLSWRVRISGKLIRIVVAQLRIRLHSPTSRSQSTSSAGLAG